MKNFKNGLVLILLMAFAVSSQAQKNVHSKKGYVIKGELTNYPFDKIYYREFKENGKIDSTNVVDGKFEMKGSLVDPVQITLNSKDGSQYARFYLANDMYTVKGDLKTASITGGKVYKDSQILDGLLKVEQDKMISSRASSGAKIDREAQQEAMMKMMERQNDIKLAYIKNNPDSFVGLLELTILTHLMPPTPVLESFNGLSDELKHSQTGQELKARLDILMKSAVGAQVMDFTQNNVDGKPITFSEFNKGKYVLIDFWASWCGPCRAENPNVLAAYNEYHPKGFDVISVSIDDDGDKWKKAIKEDGMPWMQVSDLKGQNNEVALMYGIQAVPTTLLVNPEGKIIARNLRGKALQDKLAEVIK